MKKDGDFSRDEQMTSLIADLTWIATGWAPEPLMLEDSRFSNSGIGTPTPNPPIRPWGES